MLTRIYKYTDLNNVKIAGGADAKKVTTTLHPIPYTLLYTCDRRQHCQAETETPPSSSPHVTRTMFSLVRTHRHTDRHRHSHTYSCDRPVPA